MKYFRFFVCALLVLIVSNGAYAQYQIAQSRFITDTGPFSQTCSIGGGSSASDCMPDVNGVVYMRFDPMRVMVSDNGTPGDTSDDRFEFVVQVRKTGAALPYSVGGLGIEYNTAAFGENLNTPAFHDNNTGTTTGSGQCTYTRGSGLTSGYGLVIVDTSASLLSVFEIDDDFISDTATANSFATINDEWQDLISFSCQIINADGDSGIDAEAGLAFSNRLWGENQVWIAGNEDSSTRNRTVFGIADNDLRGFRLDGKTWVEDYARHDDGRGVRLKFSKGVAAYGDGDMTMPMPLTANNFVMLDSNRQTTGGDIVVEHTAGDDYVNLRFASAVSRGILRLVSSTSRIIRDADDVELADGNFAAALSHDVDAPAATGIRRIDYSYDNNTQIGMSTWEISFSAPLNPATVIKENFCLTAEPGNCAPSSLYATTASIVSVSLDATHGTTVNVVINEGRVKHAPPPLSLEFKRNAVLGADFRIVEDYQVALRDQIQLTDRIPPVITVEAQGDAVPIADGGGVGYRVSYIVRADEPANLDPVGTAYLLVGVVDNDSLLTSRDISRLERTRSGVLTTSTLVTTRIYFPGDGISFEQLQTIEGFTLALAVEGALEDRIPSGNEPVRASDDQPINRGDRIDLSDAAIASRADRTPPLLTLTKIGDAVPDINNPRRYSGQFSVTANEANINGINDAASYNMLRKAIGSDEFVETSSTLTLISQNPSTFEYQVELASLDVVRQTEGFTLARGDDGRHLVDADYNFPVNQTNETIGTGEPIDANVVSERNPLNITDAPTITVRAIDMRVDTNPDPNIETIYQFEAVPDLSPADGNRYTMQFAAQANRPISGIGDESSYQLIARLIDQNAPVSASSMTIVLRAIETSRNSDATTLTYAVELDSVAATQRVRGFTLARGTNINFVGIYGNALAVNIGDVLDTAATAIARRDTQRPSISVVQTFNAINPNGYSLSFNITADEILQSSVAAEFYTVLRRLDGGSYAVVSSPVDFSISNVNLSSYNISAEVRLSEAEARDTVGLTLGYGGDGLRDLANNDPITIGPVRLFDDSDGALAATNQTHPSINVVAQGAVMPDENDPLLYRGAFEVSANTTLNASIRGVNGIVGLSNGASYWLWHIPSDGAPSTRTAQISAEVGTANTSATISFATRFASIAEVIQTMGFTLARRDNLQDFASNYPVDPVNTENEVARGQRLDSRDDAVAFRDDEPPSYTVAREGNLSIAASGYTMAFRVTAPDDVPSTQFSDLRQSSSYSLLRKLQDSDTYEVMPGRLVDEITVVTTGIAIVRYTNTARLSIDDAVNTEGFTLGRSADDRLRDEANNDPVVSIGGTTQTVTTTPPLPLDASAPALFMIERDRPSLTVAPRGLIVKDGTAYRGSFNVRNTEEGIDGIESSASYVLLRVPKRENPGDPAGTPVVVLADAQISVGSVNFATLQRARVSFEVNDPDADANTEVYTLGRQDRLSDLVGNPLVDPDDASVVIDSEDRIDSRASAEAAIPADDTAAPIIRVVADGDAVATADNPMVYQGTFEVSANVPVSGISNAGSYNLLRITRGGEHIITTATIRLNNPMDANISGTTAMVAFSTTLTTASLQQTYGFTLGRRANLANDTNVSAVVDADRADRLDASDDAVAEVDRPLQITAEAIVDTSHILARFFVPFNQPDGPKAYPKVDDANDLNVNGNRYSMIFAVSSLNGEAIPDIGSTSSYVLLHVPTDGNVAIDLSSYIVENSVEMVSSDQTRARVRYTVEFGADNSDEALALTRRTAGFVLGRAAGKLQSDAPPLDSDGNTIADNTRINPNPMAIADRDTQSPTVMMVDRQIRAGPNGIVVQLEAETDSGEALKPQWLDLRNLEILRKLNDSSYVPFERGGANITFITFISDRLSANSNLFRLSQNEAQETVGFTLGYTGTAPLRDLSNNDVIQGGSTRTIVTGQPFDIRDSAVAFRDTTPPFIEVKNESRFDVLSSADLVFTMTASEPVHGLGSNFFLDGRPAGRQGAYQLLRILENDSFVPHNESIFITIDSISTTQARITYTDAGLTLAQTQETSGFALGRRIQNDDDLANPNRCLLCDYSGNPPVVVGTTRTVANNEPLDPRPSAQAVAPDKVSPTITLQALSDAIPNERNPYIYTGQFEVMSTEPLTISSLIRLGNPPSYILLRVPLGEDGSASTPVEVGMIAGTTATLSVSLPPEYRIENPDDNPFVYLAISQASVGSISRRVTVDFGVELAPEIARQTYGFVLGRAPVTNIFEDDCILCDASSNPPRNRNGDLIAERAPLDTTLTAIVRRDIIPPSFVVTAESLDIQSNGYAMSFGITPPDDVSSATTSEVRRASSYRLLHKLNDSDSYEPVSASLQPIAASGNIELRYTMPPLSIEQIRQTESFAVGLAVAGRLRDTSGNDPVVNIGGTTQTVTIIPPLPLDASATAQLEVERTSPTIMVRANALNKDGNDYNGSFVVSSTESIDGIMQAGSYLLLRARSGEQDVILSDAAIGISIADLNNLRSATIHFSVNDRNTTAGDSFTLGRQSRLTDFAGNSPVDPVDADNPIDIGERIDSSEAAAAEVPADDTVNPIITVRADGNATPTTDNPLVYGGSFGVFSNKLVTGLNDQASYRLLRLTTDGATTETAAEITVTPVSDLQVSVAFATTLTALANVNETVGFTLGRQANLDSSGNLPQVGVAGRLDASPNAVARVDRLLQITSEAVVDTSHYLSDVIPFDQANGPKAYPKVDDANDTDVNGNHYSMVFEVRSLSGGAVPGIANTSSYVLIHVPTSGNPTIDLAQYITAHSVETITSDTHVRVRYTVGFGAAGDEDATINLTQRTRGFVLGRATGALQEGNMPPLDSNGNTIDDDARIDPRTIAVAARDTQSPTVLVGDADASLGNDGFVLNFDVLTDSGEALNPQWQAQSGSGIFRKLDDDTYSRIIRAGTNANVITLISRSLRLGSNAFRLSESEARDTVGFTAGYIGTLGTSTLRDLSNNDAIQGGSTRTIVAGQPFDIRDSAVAVRDMTAPFIEVSASTATVASVRSDTVAYDMSFEVAAKQQAGEQKVDATDVRGLDAATSYQLLRVLTDGGLVAVQTVQSSSATGVSTTQATIYFSDAQVPVSEINNTVGFTLTRAPSDPDNFNDASCPLCDYASNAPLVANTTETIVGTLTMPADGFKPLDRSDAAVANIDITNEVSAPTLTVTASDAIPNPDNGDEYTMDFVVQSTQLISGNLGLLNAYRLIHKPTTGTALTLSNFVQTSRLTVNDDNDAVTLSYTLRFSDTESQTQRTAGFGLAANEGLSDELANLAINRQSEVIGVGEEIDTTTTAVARRDTVPPVITVTAAGKAIRDAIDANLYRMRFVVTVADDEQVRGLSEANSYTLLQVVETGSPQLIAGMATVTTTNSGVVVAYDNVAISADPSNPTIGITLGRTTSSLRDLANNNPVDANPDNSMETIDGDREPLDSRPSAIADFVRDMLLRVRLFLEGPFR